MIDAAAADGQLVEILIDSQGRVARARVVQSVPAVGTLALIAVSAVASVALLIGGAFYFRRMEKTFADLV